MDFWPKDARDPLGKLGFILALVGFLGVCLCCAQVWLLAVSGLCLTLLGPVAIVVGVVSFARTSDRFAKWAIIIGVIAVLYMPTLWSSYMAHLLANVKRGT